MKKNYSILAVLLFASSGVFAQLNKGDVLIGGDISKLDLTLNSSKAFTIDIDPKAAWFIKDNFAVGPYISFDLATAKEQGTSTAYGVGGFARYYVRKRDSRMPDHLCAFFVEGNAGIEGTNAAHGGGSTNGLGLGIGPGLAYFLTPNVSLETLLKFQGIVGFGSDVSTNDIVLSMGFQIYLPHRKVKALEKEMK